MSISWSLKRIGEIIEKRQENKLDCIIVISGARGSSKSTLAYKICSHVSKFHNFNPRYDIAYSREDVTKMLNTHEKWTIMADEMINVVYNRDFYSEDQKDLLKIINMNRDKCNLLICCVPNFSTLDKQFRDLVRFRLVVIKRGLAQIHVPNASNFAEDKWDTKINEKIEREWIARKQNPHLGKFTTFRGLIRYNDLSEKQQEEYIEIKREKRNQVLKLTERPEEMDSDAKFVQRLKDGKMTEEVMKEYCNLTNQDSDRFKYRINHLLKKEVDFDGKTVSLLLKKPDKPKALWKI